MKRTLLLMILGFSVVSASLYQFSVPGSLAQGTFAEAASGAPTVLYAQWMGKNLRVEGENFSDGARVLVDGEELKSASDETYPSNFVFAKKAKKKIPRNQSIILQVRNSDGQLSNDFTFYSGFVITSGSNGTVLHLSVGDTFLLYLPPAGEPPTLQWVVSIGGNDQSSLTVLNRSMDNFPIPHGQGFFEAAKLGSCSILAQASRPCPLPPEQCIPTGENLGTFSIVILVE